MTKKTNTYPKYPAINEVPEPRPLTIETLAGLHTHARTVTRLLPAHTLSTADQFAARLKQIMLPRNRDELVQLFRAVEALHTHNASLGATALVRPADHPLVARHIIPREGD